jgi:hypothetical protein
LIRGGLLGASLLAMLLLAGCPAFLSDDFQVVDEGGTDGGPTFPADAASPLDVTVPVDVTGPVSDGECADACDDADGTVLDAADDAGCPTGLLECAGGCIDPSTAFNCGACGNACGAGADLCAPDPGGSGFACTNACPGGTEVCDGACVDEQTDSNDCGGCGAAYVCLSGTTCVAGSCQSPTEGGTDSGAVVPCPAGGCPTSAPMAYTSCPFGSSNSTMILTGGVCVCNADSQCKSGKCVQVAGENDVSCDVVTTCTGMEDGFSVGCSLSSGCTGTGSVDGFDCALASPGIPVPTGSAYSCPANAGYRDTQLTCEASHTNCFCTADSQCPSGACVPDAANNDSCAGAGPCSGTGTPDDRGCEPTTAIPGCPIYIGWPSNTQCTFPTCYCNSDAACASGHCIPESGNDDCSGTGPCTGAGADDGHGCELAPSSVACTTAGGTACTTTLTPAPVLNAGGTACLCVADSDCSSGACVNADNQCEAGAGGCTGSGSHDSEDCETASSTADAWSCSQGNCDTVTSPGGVCTEAGVPCWCTDNSDCLSSGALCVAWDGCTPGGCTGTGTGNAFHCVY